MIKREKVGPAKMQKKSDGASGASGWIRGGVKRDMNESFMVLTMMFIKYPGRIKLTQLSIERYYSLRTLLKCRGERCIDEVSFPMSFALTLFHHPGEPLNPLLQIYIVRRQASGVREWRTRLCRTYELMVQPWIYIDTLICACSLPICILIPLVVSLD